MSEIFTNDPINWLKWAAVFAVLIGAFIFSMKIIKKIGYVLQGQKKVNEAKDKGHVIHNAKLVETRTRYESIETRYKQGGTNYYGSYEYEIDGETRIYHTYFERYVPPETVTLYYIKNPKKLFCMEEYSWNPFAGMIYLFFVFMPLVLAALTAMALDIPFNGKDERTREERTEEMLATGAEYEGSLIHNGVTVHFKTPEIGTGGGEYDWRTYYIDKEEKTDVKVEFGFAEELPQAPEGSRLEACELWGKKMLYEITNVPFEDEDGDTRQQEQFFAYWQLTEDTYFMVVVNGVNEELFNAYAQLLNDEKFQNSFEISSSVEN